MTVKNLLFSPFIIHETILTIANLPCCSSLVPLAIKHISSFLTSRHHSTVYTGLFGLEALFKQQPPVLTKEHEKSIMSCLRHSDPAIKKQTLQLLVVLASKDNVGSGVDNILGHVKRQELQLFFLSSCSCSFYWTGHQPLPPELGISDSGDG